MKVVVAQKGAREHFLAARALHRRGMLAQLVVDWYAFGENQSRKQKVARWSGGQTSRAGESRNEETEKLKAEFGKQKLLQRLSFSAFQLFGNRGKSALSARTEEIPDALVQAMPLRSLWWKWIQRTCHTGGLSHERALQADVAFTKAVARLNLPPHDVFFGYSYMSLEMLEVEQARGVFTVLDQIDPGPVEFRLVAEEMARHLGLAGAPLPFPTAYYDRLRREWDLADLIVVNSEWTREAIISEGAVPAKIEILPLAFEENAEKLKAETLKFETPEHRSAETPLRVLWLGQVNVRKGIHYLMEAARLLEHEKVHFDVVGTIGILPGAVASAPRNMTFHGPVSRDRAAEWYRQADVFVLPTLSDGFALTQLEAMAHGLPVIATPNCGRVVKDGKTGFIILARDVQALADAIRSYVRNPGLASEMAPLCRAGVQAYSIDTYGQNLVEFIQKHAGKR